MSWLRRNLSYANVMATIAVFLALGGTAAAALVVTGRDVKDGSLSGRDIRNASLTTSDILPGTLNSRDVGFGSLNGDDIADGSLRSRDFAAGQLPAGPKGDPGAAGAPGDKGDKGDPGAPGASATTYWAKVAPDGTLVNGSAGTTSQRLGPGSYTVTFSQPVATCASLASLNIEPTGIVYGFIAIGRVGGQNSRTEFIRIQDAVQNNADSAFSVADTC